MDENVYRAPTSDSETPRERLALAELVRFWERGRLRYNLTLLPFGILTLVVWTFVIGPGAVFLLPLALIFALGANICYLAGPLGELYCRVFFQNSADTPRLRKTLYRGGLTFSLLVTLSCSALGLVANQF